MIPSSQESKLRLENHRLAAVGDSQVRSTLLAAPQISAGFSYSAKEGVAGLWITLKKRPHSRE